MRCHFPPNRNFLSSRRPDLTEWMDRTDCNREMLYNTYRYFSLINRIISRWYSVYKQHIRPLLSYDDKYRLLDVGSGGGDITRSIWQWAKKDGFTLDVTGIDPDSRALEFAEDSTVSGFPPFTGSSAISGTSASSTSSASSSPSASSASSTSSAPSTSSTSSTSSAPSTSSTSSAPSTSSTSSASSAPSASSTSTAPSASSASTANCKSPAAGLRFLHADTTTFRNSGETFDIVISNHVLHHLSENEITPFLEDLSALASRRVICSDIERSVTGYLLFSLFTYPFFPKSYIRPDGLISTRRSFTFRELAESVPGEWLVMRQFPYRLLAIRDFETAPENPAE